MRHESRVKIFLYVSFTVISCTQPIFSQGFTTTKHYKKPVVIYNAAAYRKSIITDSLKRMTALQAFIPQLVVDLKYASKNNFTGQVLYKCPTAFARLAVAVALKRINAELALQNLGLKIFDAYRPFSVSEKMWNIVPDERYVANPAKGSGHNRGAAVDVTLIELSTEKEVEMPTAFDDFTEKAHHDYTALSRQVQENRSKLKNIMEKYGFVSLATEWWHYSLPDAATRFELLDLDFKLLRNTLRQ